MPEKRKSSALFWPVAVKDMQDKLFLDELFVPAVNVAQ